MSKVRVAPGNEPDWLAALADLRDTEREAGRHVWTFRHPVDRHLFLVFREGGAGPWPDDPAVRRRLDALGAYEERGDVVWEEVIVPSTISHRP
jgi:hypothetical protein